MQASQSQGVPQVERHPDGFLLRDNSDSSAAAYATMGMAGCFLVIPVVVGGIILATAVGTGSPAPGLIAVAVVSVFVLVGLGILRAGFRTYRTAQRWEPGELILPAWPVTPGRSMVVDYRRDTRGVDASISPMSGRLVLRESVTYRQGTDTRTVTEDVAVYPLDVTMRPSTDQGISATLNVALPPDAPTSFELDNNRLQWWVILEPVGEGDDSRFKLWVRPDGAS